MALIGSPHGCPVLPASANMALLGRLSAQCAAIRFSYYVHYILCRTHAWNILTDLQGSMQMILWMQTMVLECFACIAFTYSCTKLVDYPESSVPLVFCILKSCLESISIMPLTQRQSLQILQTWYFERFRGDFRHSVQLQVFGAASSRRFFFGTRGQCVEHLERS